MYSRRGQGAEASEFYSRAIQGGHATSAFNLGAMYFKGDGVPKDLRRATELYRLAALNGVKDAQFNMGHFYAEGLTVAKDSARAVVFFRLAAAQSDSQARRGMEMVMRYRTGGTQN